MDGISRKCDEFFPANCEIRLPRRESTHKGWVRAAGETASCDRTDLACRAEWAEVGDRGAIEKVDNAPR